MTGPKQALKSGITGMRALIFGNFCQCPSSVLAEVLDRSGNRPACGSDGEKAAIRRINFAVPAG
jgi:hypothetical protein